MWLCVHNQLKKTYAQSKETLEKVAGKSLTWRKNINFQDVLIILMNSA